MRSSVGSREQLVWLGDDEHPFAGHLGKHILQRFAKINPNEARAQKFFHLNRTGSAVFQNVVRILHPFDGGGIGLQFLRQSLRSFFLLGFLLIEKCVVHEWQEAGAEYHGDGVGRALFDLAADLVALG